MYFELGYIKLYIDFESAEYCKPTPDNNGGYLNWFEDDIDEDEFDTTTRAYTRIINFNGARQITDYDMNGCNFSYYEGSARFDIKITEVLAQKIAETFDRMVNNVHADHVSDRCARDIILLGACGNFLMLCNRIARNL